jgi:hypothetical protein
MKFKDLINEKFYKGAKITAYGKPIYVEIYKNPSPDELKQIYKTGGTNSVRIGITNEKKPDIYAWDTNIAHPYIKKQVDFDIGLAVSVGVMTYMFTDSHTIKDFENLKYNYVWQNFVHERY